MNRRADILQKLVCFELPTAALLSELRSLGWNWTGEPLLVLKKEHLLRVIDRYLAGEITAVQLQEWAENLEAREDVAFDVSEREVTDPIFFRIATPEINAPLTPEAVRQMRCELTEKMANKAPATVFKKQG